MHFLLLFSLNFNSFLMNSLISASPLIYVVAFVFFMAADTSTVKFTVNFAAVSVKLLNRTLDHIMVTIL